MMRHGHGRIDDRAGCMEIKRAEAGREMINEK
jgi:hypothetical protein